jgi:hypothetical protein
MQAATNSCTSHQEVKAATVYRISANATATADTVANPIPT